MRRIQILSVFFLFFLTFSHPCLAKDEKEVKWGFFIDRLYVSNSTIILNNELTKRINEIGNHLVYVSERSDIKYTFRIINDPIINAYAVPGGFVYINSLGY